MSSAPATTSESLTAAEAPADRELAWVVAWALAWLTPFGVFHYVLVPAGFGSYATSWVSGLWFAVAAAVGLTLFRREARARVALRATGIWPWIALSATALATVVGYAWAYTVWPLDAAVRAEFEAVQVGLIQMNGVYLIKKLPELVFQQTLMLVLVRHLQLRGHGAWKLIGWFMLIFAGIHVPLLAIKGLAAVPFIVASMLGSLVFAPLLAWLERGIVLSFCVHQLTYVIVGLVLRGCLVA